MEGRRNGCLTFRFHPTPETNDFLRAVRTLDPEIPETIAVHPGPALPKPSMPDEHEKAVSKKNHREREREKERRSADLFHFLLELVLLLREKILRDVTSICPGNVMERPQQTWVEDGHDEAMKE